jgi:hypothetical protein
MANEVSGVTSTFGGAVSGGGEISYPASDKSGRGVGGRELNSTIPSEPKLTHPNDNKAGIRNSINDGEVNVSGKAGAKIGPGAPYQRPVAKMTPISKKGKR